MLGAVALALPMLLVPATTASAAEWGINKQVTSGEGPYEPGQQVQYAIQISCSDPNNDPCTNTVMTDELPDELVLVDASVSSGSGDVVADTETNTVTYTADETPNGQQALIVVTATVDPDLPYSADGVPIPNTATVDADNADPESDTVEITPVVELSLASETTKTIEPEGALAAPGTEATMTLGATNTSNTPVDTLVVQDPVDPTADPNPFTYLEYTGTGDIEMPPNATDVTEEYWDGDSWEPLDDSVDPASVQGVRYTFSGDIQQGATATIPVEVQQSEAVEELEDPTTVTNEVQSNVTLGDDASDPVTASDTYVITPPNNSVTASKSFDPGEVSAGAPTTVTLGATNTGTPVTSMSITEPAPGTNNVFEGDDPITFTGWGTDGAGAGVVWPDGATGASVTFVCDGTPGEPIPASAPNTLPDPPAGCNVTGFTIEYTGTISNGAEATVPFTADTDPDQEPDNVDHPNQIEADVPSADPALADDTLTTLVDRLATDIEKNISPSTIPAVPGQSVVVQLPSELATFGPDGSTTDANTFVVQDPTDPANPDEFWQNFEATGVRSTDVPANATLTVNYWDGDSWEPAPDCGPFEGPTTANCDLPAGAEGVQFVYTSDDGFPPGTAFQPNFTADYTGPTDRDDPIENCGQSSASADTVEETEPVVACDTVDPFPVDGEGPGDFIDKTMLGDPATVRARTDDQVTGQITWSTGGFSGVDPMVISDITDPAAVPIEDSFYDAFNLVRVEPIDNTVDPLIQYDQVESVELFIDGAWVEASDDPCPEACDGTFPGYTLTAEEQASATSVRLTYTESPSRAENPTDPTAPVPGDGVARSTQETGRHLDLTWQVRDYKRSDPSQAVLGNTSGVEYNIPGDAGVVNNTVRGTATIDGEDFVEEDADEATILDVPLNVTVDKEWAGGPVSVPPDGTPPQFYPSTIATITGTNNSAAKVEELRLADPTVEGSGDVETADGTKPFDAFTLTAIDLTPPEGTETTTVTLHYDDDTTATFTEDEAEALAVSDLDDVVGVEVAYDGLVAPGAAGSMDLTLQLRQFDRYSDAPITVADYSPVPNMSAATIDDPGGTTEDVRLDNDDATMELQDAEIALEVGKSFTPDTIVEPNHGNPGDTPVVMTLTGQPQGPSRSVEMVLTDDDPQFWNQYDFVGFDPSADLARPIQQVQVDAFTGGTFTGEPGSEDPVTVTGGDWVTGTPSDTFTLPDGVAPEDVQGLRFTFTRTDGSIWENPATPTQEVPIQILRRDEMRSGGPVLPDLAANPPGPGETDPGVASNSVQGSTTGADLVTDPDTGELVPVSATDEAESSILYQHATNGVMIEKDFDGVPTGGTEAPEATFPMNITFTNTGDRPIVDPVVTDDPMPFDDEGAQLRIAEGEDEPFSYSLGGVSDPDTSTPDLPTDAAQVTVDQQGDIDSLGFSFPEGSVLEVGQSYTITVMVQFRLGLPPQTPVENTAGVTGDRPWDECAQRLNEETGACEADADVTPTGSAALQQQKLVKATDDDELDVMLDPAYPDQSFECTPNGAGFYAYPCTPVIAPGHNETWQVGVENVGNLPMDTLVLYDRLPTPGDTGSYAGADRGSEWAPILTNDPPPEFVNLPPGAEGTFYYSTTQDYCMGDIEDPITMPCPTGDPETGWVELTGDESEEVYQQITALKVVVTFPEDDLFEPGDSIALEGTTTTPPAAPEAGDRSIAWNSAAAGGVVVTQQAGRQNNLPTEGVKVGVATATGPLEVNKFVTGDGADQYAPDSFEVQVECTSAVGTWVETDLDPVTITVSPDEPVTVPNLPYGAECTLTEDAAVNGQTDFTVTPESVTIGDETAPAQIAITNEYDLASLELSKDVVSDAVDQDGNPISYGPFEAAVECTFLGEEVFAEGYDADTPMVVELDADGTPVTLEGLPVNAECTVTETDTAGAASTSMTVTQPGEDPVTTDGTSADVVIVPDDEGTAGTQVGVTNTFGDGAIHLTKVVEGEGAPEYGDGPFTFDIVCTLDDTGGEPRTVYEDSVSLGGDDPLELTIENLPAGAECDITETDDGGATDTVVTPNPVTVGAGETAEVTATNTFDVGGIVVDKVVDGAGADLYGDGPFEVTLECTYQGEPVEIDPATQTLVGGESVSYDGIPVGAECVVTETEDGGATSSTVSTTVEGGDPGEVVVPPAGDDPAEITVTNTFDVGEVVVDKMVDGDGAQYGTGPFEVTLECTYQGEAIEIPGGATREITPGEPVTYGDLPVGADCVVTEPTTGGATEVTISSVDDGAPGEVTIGDDPTEVTVTNTFDLASLQVTKDLAGLGALYGPGPFEVELSCTFESETIAIPGGELRTINGGQTITYDDLPVGAVCAVTETQDFGATSVEMDPVGEGDPATSGDVTVGGADEDPVVITVTNTFETSPLVVRKVVDGEAAEFAPPMPDLPAPPEIPDPLPTDPDEIQELVDEYQQFFADIPFDEFPYQASISCVDDQGVPVETIPGGDTRRFGPGFPALYFGLQDGDTCTVTETGTGGATSVSYLVPPDEEPQSEPVTVPVDGADLADPVEVVVTNIYDVGEFTVEKVVDGEGAQYGTGPFEVTAECTFEGNAIEVPDGATRTVAPDEPAVYAGLPVGADCVVTETEDGGATSTTVSTAVDGGGPGEVVVPPSDGEQVTLTATNTFDLGELTVDKVVVGDGAELYGDGPFEVSLECTFEGEPVEIPGGAVREITPGEPVTYTELPVGADCVVTETDVAGATSSTVSTTVEDGEPGQVVVPGTDGDPVTVTVTNTFDVGSIAVDKVVEFEGDSYDVGPFEVALECTFQGESIEIPDGAARELTPGDPVTYDGLPVGADCVVTETDDGGAAASTVSSVDGGDPGAVTVAADPASVTVTNTFGPPPPPADGGDDGGNGGATGGDDSGLPGWLPRTGADFIKLLGLVVLLTAAGVVLVNVRRRGVH
ncbi:DUF5979 domain-containing protein [Isoptericola cucumis]|uniref:DUF5979 domain-containing protein n=1 Tax=Isoptericola cucumis TaxID=1776856 RepID=A0ABQ2B8T9_9MICO|nr:DUF5979 domain-containing protein [Isoptericola cucumis]GGI10725.1 hypothetical protein GCM10007368_32660 [Isoptericola cucumis]